MSQVNKRVIKLKHALGEALEVWVDTRSEQKKELGGSSNGGRRWRCVPRMRRKGGGVL